MCREPRMRNADCSDFEMEIMMLPSVDPWSTVRNILEELKYENEKLYIDYCDAMARIRAISKIVESNQAPQQKIEGIKPLAELEVTE